MVRKIALCIPIYNTDYLAQEFLENYSKSYLEMGIDIYYYDSTPDDRVKKVVEKWVDNDRIFYQRMDSNLQYGEKMFKIYQGYGQQREYQYIWLCNDGVRVSPVGLEMIQQHIGENFDIITLDVLANKKQNESAIEWAEKKIYKDPNAYFNDCFVASLLYGDMIVSTNTVLKNVNWSQYEEKCLNTLGGVLWAQVGFFFNRILELKTFSALYLPLTSEFIRFSELKRESQWTNKLFFALCEGLVQSVQQLPDCYQNKRQACQKGGIAHINGFAQLLTLCKRDGRYSLKVFLKYFNKWPWVTSIPRWQLFLAALVPKWAVSAIALSHKKKGHRKLMKFCQAHSRVVLYGAGGCGYCYADYFNKMGIKFDSFCVTRRKPGKFRYCDHPVYELEELKSNLDDIGFIVAVGGNSTGVVIQNLKTLVDRSDIFFEPKFQEEMRYEWAREKKNALNA